MGIGRGLRMNIDFDGGQTRLFLGLYEVELSRHLRRLCRPGHRAFDVGGQYGYDALVIAKLTGAEVLSLECDEDYCTKIVENVALNPMCADRIRVEKTFVSDTTTLAFVGGAATRTLDRLASEFFLPDFIKMDIEGAEVDALHGADSILSTRMPSLLIEVHSVELERSCCEILTRHGYKWTAVDPRRWLPDYRPIEHNRWLVAEGRTTR